MENILISVIVPAYNIEAYIERCLESIINQTYKLLEIIVVDDGSQDTTASKVSVFAAQDERIRLIRKKNGGVTSARLAGVQAATGEYIGFVDGDDLIDSDMYEHLLNNAVKYHADISHCGYQMEFPNRVDYYYNTGRLLHQNNLTGLKDLLSGWFIEPGLWNKLFHRSLFDNLLKDNPVDLKIKINEDLLMNYFLFKESSLSVYEDWCPYHYVVRNNSATSASLSVQKLTDPIKVLKRLEEETKDNEELYHIVLQRMTSQLINLSSFDIQHRKDLIAVQLEARKMLKNRFYRVMKSHVCSTKNKILVLWVSIWPWSYGLVHKIYAHVTGKNKKYSVD